MNSLSLTSRLLLLSLLFILIPLISWLLLAKFEKDIERDAMAESKEQAQILAGFVNQLLQTDRSLQQKFLNTSQQEQFPIALKETAVLIDGFSDEWYPYQSATARIHNFGQDARLTLIEDKDFLYGLFEVEDNSIVYRKRLDLAGLSDKIALVLGSYQMQFLPMAPGKVPALRQTADGYREVTPVYAVWQERTEGYQLEFRVPQSLVGKTISADITDIDRAQSGVALQGIYSFTNFKSLSLHSRLQSGVLSLLEPEQYRLTLTNTRGEVLYQFGQLHTDIRGNWRNRIWSSAIKEKTNDSLLGKKSISSVSLDLAFTGRTQSEVVNATQLSAFARVYKPLYSQNRLVGMMILESSPVNDKLQLRDFWLRFLLLLGLVWGLFIWWLVKQSRRYSQRIMELRDLTEGSISEEGQIRYVIDMDEEFDDEVSDLTNSFSLLTTRLKQYHDYQAKLVARLNHELRTPIAIIRSSLDNINRESLPADELQLIDNAQSGAVRMSQTISRLSEANRLEQAIRGADKEPFDMIPVLRELAVAYRTNWTDHAFELVIEPEETRILGSKDLFVQMLDKLISNAVDFDNKSKPITISLTRKERQLVLRVNNAGPTIAKKHLHDVFSLMHSSRKHSNQHLGLGLYVARLIASFHGAKVYAENKLDDPGVTINIVWRNKHFTASP
ncbi:MAG: ATP-binding protein [Kangiella sp.]|jgi:two-component system sensor histidine kinase ChvG|nr:ATP-binding protein [Kangiella sp.]MCW9028230.1 ATP-binding protein [Kangiella sp.]